MWQTPKPAYCCDLQKPPEQTFAGFSLAKGRQSLAMF